MGRGAAHHAHIDRIRDLLVSAAPHALAARSLSWPVRVITSLRVRAAVRRELVTCGRRSSRRAPYGATGPASAAGSALADPLAARRPHAARDTTKVGSHGRQTGSWLRHLLQLPIVQPAVTVTPGLPSRHSLMASPAQTRRPLTRKLAPATKTGKSGGGLDGAGVVVARPVILAARDDIAAAAAHQELGPRP
jgi:hypothetical protein